MDTIQIGKNIKRLRSEKKMTQNELSERLNISYQAVSKWERGVSLPDVSLLIDLANILETTTDNILLGGGKIMGYNNKLSAKEIKKALLDLSQLKNKIGKDNTLYQGIIDGINTSMNIDIEECFLDNYKFEAIIAEVIIQNFISGAYIDLSEAKTVFENERWFDIVAKYAKKHAIV